MSVYTRCRELSTRPILPGQASTPDSTWLGTHLLILICGDDLWEKKQKQTNRKQKQKWQETSEVLQGGLYSFIAQNRRPDQVGENAEPSTRRVQHLTAQDMVSKEGAGGDSRLG